MFVNGATGSDTASCGGFGSPCKTVQEGISQAHNSAGSTPNVYLAVGSYTESIALQTGVNVYGGLLPGATSWAQGCDPTATVIVAPTSSTVTVTAASIGGSAKLSTLTVQSKATANAGESIVGIVATGASTNLTLEDVTVKTIAGGNGLAAGAPTNGTTPTGTCGTTPGDAGPGQSTAKGPGADAGWFGAPGYVVGSGALAQPGGTVMNGTKGGAGACVACVVTCTGSIVSCAVATSST